MWTAELERGRASREPRERAEAGALAVIVGPEDGRTRTAGGRACDTTNNARFARATGGIDGGEEERGKASAAAAIPSARSLARL